MEKEWGGLADSDSEEGSVAQPAWRRAPQAAGEKVESPVEVVQAAYY